MAASVLTNAGIWLDGYNLSGDFNTVSLSAEVEEKDATVFGATTRTMRGGLRSVSISGAGFWDANATTGAEPDDVIQPRVGSGSTALTITNDTTVGSTAYFVQPLISKYEFSPQVGELKPFSLGVVARGAPLVRGVVAFNSTASSGTLNGSGFLLGSPTATQRAYIALHVLAVSGTSPTLDVTFQSATTADFSAATNRLILTQATAVGAQWNSTTGPSSGADYWRVRYTVGGTGSPTVQFVAAIGII